MHWTSFAGTDNAFAMCSAPVGPILLSYKSIFWIVLFSYQIKKGVLSLTKESATEIFSSIVVLTILLVGVFAGEHFDSNSRIILQQDWSRRSKAHCQGTRGTCRACPMHLAPSSPIALPPSHNFWTVWFFCKSFHYKYSGCKKIIFQGCYWVCPIQ